jgi:hypothetical protein
MSSVSTLLYFLFAHYGFANFEEYTKENPATIQAVSTFFSHTIFPFIVKITAFGIEGALSFIERWRGTATAKSGSDETQAPRNGNEVTGLEEEERPLTGGKAKNKNSVFGLCVVQ